MQMLHAGEQESQMQSINPSQTHTRASQMKSTPANA